MPLIIPPRKRLIADPYIAPAPGDWGPCALCKTYSKLTEAHVPPQAVGNTDEWRAKSYMTALTAGNDDVFYPRHFRGGLRFKTLCRDCNSSLGGREDKALANYFEQVRKLVESPILLASPIIRIAAKPNLIYRGMFAHLASANDNGIPCSFDDEAREIFFRKRDISASSWSLFYWLYLGKNLSMTRNAFHATWQPTTVVRPMFLLKIYPLAFLFVQESWFAGCANVRRFLQRRDDEQVELPLQIMRCDLDPFWPATASPTNVVLAGGNTFGVLGSRR